MSRTRLPIICAVVVVSLVGCDPPVHPKNFASTVVASTCHFIHDCCTPSERQVLIPFPFLNKDACLEEVEAAFGGLMNVAIEAIDKGTATFDAEAAEACTGAIRTAIDQCDATAVVGSDGNIDANRLFFLFDGNDPVCAALAQRGFSRGELEDGDECVSSVECADFGTCENDNDGGGFTVGGTCRAAAGEGDACDDRRCLPGLLCSAELRCEEPPPLADDGDDCTFDFQCVSGFCSGAGDFGRCSTDETVDCEFDEDCTVQATCDQVAGRCDDAAQTACFVDFDCPDIPGTCVPPAPGECTTLQITSEICDGA